MAWHIKNIRKWPNGGFSFRQGGDKPMYFPGDYDFHTQVKTILQYRRANDLPRATEEEVAADLHHYVCSRLGFNPGICREADGTIAVTSPKSVRTARRCGTCGARVVNHSK
jgi:hypothetical protein